MLNNYDEGRSKSFYCIATTLLPIKDIEKSLDETKQKLGTDDVKWNDIKTKAKILKGFLNDFATLRGIELKIRKKAKN